MRLVLIALGRAILSQLQFKMLLLTVLPFVLSLVVWGILLWLGLQPMLDWLHNYFIENNGFAAASQVLAWFNLETIKTILVPLIAMWVLLPLMILTALLFVAFMAMPLIVKHVASRHFPDLVARNGGSMWGSVWITITSLIMFLGLWLITLPLSLFPPLAFIVQPVLWGWLTYRVIAYDALAEHASAAEYAAIVRLHRWPLFAMGAITGVMGAAPSLLWLGGVLSVIFFPLLAAGAIWLYVLIFVFTGLWFEHYCLQALANYRMTSSDSGPATPVVASN